MLLKTMSTSQIGEEVLWIENSRKHPSGFEPLYNRYFEPIYRFVYQRVDSKEAAADTTSQVFLKALVNIDKYTFRGLPFFAWLCRIAISEIGNYYSRSKKFRVVNIETSGLFEMAENIDTEVSDEQIMAITTSFKDLSDDEMLLIEMRFFESRSFKEIGEILHITENYAKVKTYRILDKIKKLVPRNTQLL
jgi:RNA polymerase sigma-70 factor (ECF subfamily)